MSETSFMEVIEPALELFHEDKMLQENYPDKYKLFLSYYNNYTILGILGAFLKRMRRYKIYPNENMYAPVYSLDDGSVLYKMKFYVMKNNKVKVISIDNIGNIDNTVVSSITSAWEFYKNKIINTFSSERFIY